MMRRPVPLNFFGIPFGLVGLAGTWVTLAHYRRVPATAGDGLLVVAGITWAVVLLCYLRHVRSGRGLVGTDLRDPVAGPFASLALITPMLLATEGVYPRAAIAGKVLVDIFLIMVVVLGGWFTGQWIYGPLEFDKVHPGYFLPTVAGGMLSAACAAAIGQRRLAEAMFGLGAICWIVMGSIILARLFIRPPLPRNLTPTLAIEVAPAAVASLAYFNIDGDRIDFVTAALAGYGLLMILAQVRLVPAYRHLGFMPSLWAFTFSWAAVASSGVHWLENTRPVGYRTYEYLILVVISAGIGSLAARTVIAFLRHQLLPAPAIPGQPARLSTSVPAPEGVSVGLSSLTASGRNGEADGSSA